MFKKCEGDRKRASHRGKMRATGRNSHLLFVCYNMLITNVIYYRISSKKLGVDFPGAVFVGTHAFNDSFLAEAR